MEQTDPPEKVASNAQLGLLPITRHDHPEPRTMVWSELELRAIRSYAGRCVASDRERRALDRCWVPPDGPLRCDGCGKTIAEHDRLLRCGGPSPEMTEDRVMAIVRSEVIRLGLVVVRDAMD